MKLFNITAQVYKNSDTSKQNLFINQVMDGDCSNKALENFKLHFPSIEYTLVKIYSTEEIVQATA
jgi:hypothetical protein